MGPEWQQDTVYVQKKGEENKMSKLKPCKYCGKSNIVVARLGFSEKMYMVKCENSECPVPPEGYPTGRNLSDVEAEWDKRNSKML